MPQFEITDPMERNTEGSPAASDASEDAAEQERVPGTGEEMLDSSRIEASVVLLNLGGVHYRCGRLAEAHKAYVRALEIAEEALGPDHAELARIYQCLAELELTRGRFVTGEPYARRSLEIRERSQGAHGRDSGELVKVLAALLDGQGRSAESELLRCRADTAAGPAVEGSHQPEPGSGNDES